MLSRRRSQEGSAFPPPTQSVRRVILLGWALACAGFIGMSCTSRPPEVRPEPESKIVIPAAPRISSKPYHRSMRDEMDKSFDRADEIVIGVYTGTYADGPPGRAHYFDQFRVFNKDTWTWGPEMTALLPVLFQDVKPEIITGLEFKSLSSLDKTGICWDDYEGPRVIFLVEGVPNLLFLRQIFDGADNTSRRILIDAYPVTKDCRAKDVFDLMLREHAGMSGKARGFSKMREGFHEPFSGLDRDFGIVISGRDMFIVCFF